MKSVSVDEASALLAAKRLKIGGWSEARPITDGPVDRYEKMEAPRDVDLLQAFASHLVGMLLPSSWILLQIDNSTSFNAASATRLRTLLLPAVLNEPVSDIPERSWVLEIRGGKENHEAQLVHVWQIVALLLADRHHCQLVSSALAPGSYVSLQDGIVYLIYGSDGDGLSIAPLQSCLELATVQGPQWLVDMISNEQGKLLR